MAIKGLTDRSMERDARAGRLVRLGTIQKGERTGFGKEIKLFDYDYLRFTPANGDERLTAAFAAAYGKEPKVIPDVRIPVDMAGNFDIGDCSWYVASKHTEKGSTFLARSDGENIKQARRESDGRKVDFFYDGEMPHDKHTRPDNRGNPGFVYAGKVYAWQKSFAIDLILPDFNRLVFDKGLAGYGAVTLITTSTNDIANLTSEYQTTIINELAAPFINPLTENAERVKQYLPLRNFPIRLYRQKDKVSTPEFGKDASPDGRMITEKWLLHWQVAADFSASIQQAIDARTAALITAAAQQTFLTDGRDSQAEVARLNSDLFADADEAPLQLTAEASTEEYAGPDWEELSVPIDGEYDEEAEEDDEVYDWQEAIDKAKTLEGFAFAYYQKQKPAGVFKDANAIKKAFTHFFGKELVDGNQDAYTASLDAYVDVIADGGTVKAAKKKTADVFEKELEKVPF